MLAPTEAHVGSDRSSYHLRQELMSAPTGAHVDFKVQTKENTCHRAPTSLDMQMHFFWTYCEVWFDLKQCCLALIASQLQIVPEPLKWKLNEGKALVFLGVLNSNLALSGGAV